MYTLLGATVATAMLCVLVITVNIQRACAIRDTPYLPLCSAQAPSVSTIRNHIANNPGDAQAFVDLALTETGSAQLGAVKAAVLVAPTHHQVLLLRASTAATAADAVPALVALAEYHNDAMAIKALARLAASGQSALLEPHLIPGSHWVGRVLFALPASGGSITSALPLVPMALRQHAIDASEITPYVTQLKAAGAWNDAFSLWLTIQGKALPYLFNGSFDDPLIANGFDWEINMPSPLARSGAFIDRSSSEGRGAVLNIKFTGRPIALPMVRQVVFLGGGRFRMKGDYRSDRLRVERGLSWVVRCVDRTAAELGRSGPLNNTGNAWVPFKFEFDVSAQCGSMASVGLELANAADALTGARGEIWLDDLSIERLAD